MNFLLIFILFSLYSMFGFAWFLSCPLHAKKKISLAHTRSKSPRVPTPKRVCEMLLFRSLAYAWIVLNPEVVVEVEKRMNRCYLPPRLLPGGHLKAAGGPTLTHHRKASMYPTNNGKFSISLLFLLYFFNFLFFCFNYF